MTAQQEEKEQEQRRADAAIKIQKAFRGHAVRKKLLVDNLTQTRGRRIIGRASYIGGVRSDWSLKESEKLERLKKGFRASRRRQEKRLQALDRIHPSLIQRFLEEEAREAALRIQSWWRGWRCRRWTQKERLAIRRHKAAAVIQRFWRQLWARRSRARETRRSWAGLDEERRSELQKQIDEFLESKKGEEVTDLVGLREQCQQLLSAHRRATAIRDFQRRQTLLANIQLDVELLEKAPSLATATASDVAAFRSSRAVGAAALRSHLQQLQTLRISPWKKNLGLDDDCLS